MVTVRRATRADADEMAASAIEAWRVGFAGLVPESVRPEDGWSATRIAEQLEGEEAAGRRTLVAELEGRVRGLAVLGPSRDRAAPALEGEVIALYVHPDVWRRGVGRALVDHGLDALAEMGCEEVIVWTLAESARNIAFYEALGFRLDGATQSRPSFGSTPEVRLRKRVGPRGGRAGIFRRRRRGGR